MSDEWRKMQLETRVKKWFCVSYISKRNGKRIVKELPWKILNCVRGWKVGMKKKVCEVINFKNQLSKWI